MNNKDILENTITTVHFLAADHKIQHSALPRKREQQITTNKQSNTNKEILQSGL